MSGQGNTREGRLEGQRLELCAPRRFPGNGILQKLPPEDALTPCAVSNACHQTPRRAHSLAPYFKLPDTEPGTQCTLHTYSHFIPSYRPQTCCQYTSFTTVTYRIPWSHVTPRTYIQLDTRFVSHKQTYRLSQSPSFFKGWTLFFWDRSHLSSSVTHTHKSSSFALQANFLQSLAGTKNQPQPLWMTWGLIRSRSAPFPI